MSPSVKDQNGLTISRSMGRFHESSCSPSPTDTSTTFAIVAACRRPVIFALPKGGMARPQRRNR